LGLISKEEYELLNERITNVENEIAAIKSILEELK